MCILLINLMFKMVDSYLYMLEYIIGYVASGGREIQGYRKGWTGFETAIT